jgi:alpha-tubulin suppressor-like RCC1 family protein
MKPWCTTPSTFSVLAGSPVKFWQVAAGYGHGCAISQGRSEIWCWGTNGYGETGVAPGPVAPATWEVPNGFLVAWFYEPPFYKSSPNKFLM